MFANLVITAGWCGIVVAIVYYMVQGGTSALPSHVETTRELLLGSAGVIVLGTLLKFLASALGINKGRCQKCGKRIQKSEMYCFDHQREAYWRAKDHDKTLGTRIR